MIVVTGKEMGIQSFIKTKVCEKLFKKFIAIRSLRNLDYDNEYCKKNIY